MRCRTTLSRVAGQPSQASLPLSLLFIGFNFIAPGFVSRSRVHSAENRRLFSKILLKSNVNLLARNVATGLPARSLSAFAYRVHDMLNVTLMEVRIDHKLRPGLTSLRSGCAPPRPGSSRPVGGRRAGSWGSRRVRHGRRLLQGATVLEVGRDPGRPKRVIPDPGGNSSRPAYGHPCRAAVWSRSR